MQILTFPEKKPCQSPSPTFPFCLPFRPQSRTCIQSLSDKAADTLWFFFFLCLFLSPLLFEGRAPTEGDTFIFLSLILFFSSVSLCLSHTQTCANSRVINIEETKYIALVKFRLTCAV